MPTAPKRGAWARNFWVASARARFPPPPLFRPAWVTVPPPPSNRGCKRAPDSYSPRVFGGRVLVYCPRARAKIEFLGKRGRGRYPPSQRKKCSLFKPPRGFSFPQTSMQAGGGGWLVVHFCRIRLKTKPSPPFPRGRFVGKNAGLFHYYRCLRRCRHRCWRRQ